MDIETFNKFLQDNQAIIRKLATGKNKEYSRGDDKLHNFKRASEVRRRMPERCLEAMMSKHIISIYDMLDDLEKDIHHSYELWNEKINDSILYLHLLKALLYERYSVIDLSEKSKDGIMIRD